jgi:predicted nucleic acid-binding protein
MTSTTALFVDTWGWLTLRDRREEKHAEAKKDFDGAVAGRGGIITTDFVLDETFTLLFRRLAFNEARDSMMILSESIEAGEIVSVPISSSRFKAAQALRLKFKDKPDISFTDLCSMVVMRELGVRKILTEDAHFEHVGMGFELAP